MRRDEEYVHWIVGLQSNSGTTPGGAPLSTIGNATPITFGQDPDDLTNARGRLPNDRPHVFRIMGKAFRAAGGR